MAYGQKVKCDNYEICECADENLKLLFVDSVNGNKYIDLHYVHNKSALARYSFPHLWLATFILECPCTNKAT